VAEDAFSIASQHSSVLFSRSIEVLSCAHRSGMSLDMPEKCQLFPERIPSLFEQNVLKAVSRTQTEVRSNWSPLTDDSYSSSFYLLQSMWPCRWRWVCVASQQSIGLVDIKWGTFMHFMRPTEQICHLICRRNASLFQWEFLACSNRMSWKQSAGHR